MGRTGGGGGGGIDNYIRSLPGSPAMKAAVASGLIIAVISVPVFFVSKEGRQGHDYFSQEKPEAIRAGEEQQRKIRRKQREEEMEQLRQQQQTRRG